MAALPSFFLSNIFPILQTSINGPKLITSNFLLRYFRSALNTYSLDYIFIFQDFEVLMVLISPSASQAFPDPHGSPCQCPAPHSPAWPLALLAQPQPTPLPILRRCPMPGAAPVPPAAQLPSGVLGWALDAISCPHRSWDTEQSPWCYGYPAPRVQAAEFKSSLSPSKITHHYHKEHSPPCNQLFITCSHFTAVFPSMPLTNFILQFSHL